VDSDEILDGLYSGLCDVAYAINTDSRLAAWDLTVLDDTRDFFPTQAIAPVGPTQRLASISGFETKVETLAELLGNNMLRELGSRVEYGEDGEADSADEQSVREVATLFLCENELISTCADG